MERYKSIIKESNETRSWEEFVGLSPTSQFSLPEEGTDNYQIQLYNSTIECTLEDCIISLKSATEIILTNKLSEFIIYKKYFKSANFFKPHDCTIKLTDGSQIILTKLR